MNQFRQRLQQLAETDIAVWFYGEHDTGRMTGARYLHQLGRNAKGPFVRYELTPENAGQLETFIDQAQGGTLVLSYPEYLTREQQHHLARLQSLEHRPFRLVGVGSASLVEQAAANQIAAELYYCFAMTKSPASLFLSDRMISSRYFAIIFEKPACDSIIQCRK